jgi:hypothetical protein
MTVTAFAQVPKTRAFNPDISANFLGLAEWGSGLSDDFSQMPRNGLSLQEAEIQFNADVDPYFRAAVLLSVAQEEGSRGFGIDPEEVYLETISLPYVTVKAGKFKLALGRHNQLHTHAFPFIDAPLIHQLLLGDEGLNEVGVSVAALLPINWYSEVIVQGFSPGNEALFNSTQSRNIAGLARLRNLWDLNSDLTFELGVSGTAGKNGSEQTSSVIEADLTFKWRPSAGGKYRALIWSTEYLDSNRDGFEDEAGQSIAKLGGVATWLQFQFAERWWIQGRYEYVGIPREDALEKMQKQSALLGFFPSEFSGLRLQYDHLYANATHDHTVALQFNISIGAHPAHAY